MTYFSESATNGEPFLTAVIAMTYSNEFTTNSEALFTFMVEYLLIETLRNYHKWVYLDRHEFGTRWCYIYHVQWQGQIWFDALVQQALAVRQAVKGLEQLERPI